MADVWLLVRVGDPDAPGYRPTPDAIVRFGGAAIGTPPRGAAVPATDPGDHQPLLDRIVDELTDRFADVFGRETVARFVTESYALLASRASVQRFLPALTARFTADRLTALATPLGDGAPRDGRLLSSVFAAQVNVLFVCSQNAGRSQIAGAVLRSLAGDRVLVRTAGTASSGPLDPGVRAELDRRGLGGLAELPRPLTDEVVRASGVVVTMGCGDACPVLPGRRYLDWPLDDPAGRSPAEVRRIADDITERVRTLLDELSASEIT
ncbi:hypothetical protein IHE71_20980 [Myceligenerans sp. TRM 65318]|uniref:Phosphotyrosine protein phosphatase I domain-containing protein n=2 Tax=Myceligenerans pegani TaxID=2776917 RepID=A0ABR9N4A7_9MICO|nr:hypothetical protein [Myceligenerans sp. TRM 65318]MBE3020441.1 hypothetical protein [Myceligenerans sp. TRM 65318]